MQMVRYVIAHLLLPALAHAVAPAEHGFSCPGSDEGSACPLPIVKCLARPEEGLWAAELNQAWTVASSSTSTSPTPIKEQGPSTERCGLGVCATARITNQFAPAMQMVRYVIAHLLLPALAHAVAPAEHGFSCPGSDEGSACPLPIVKCLARPEEGLWAAELNQAWTVASSSTSTSPTPIKEQGPSTERCGLGVCATARITNQFAPAMQVGEPYVVFSKRSGNYFLVQLPSPHCCMVIIAECVHVIRALLILAGDVETNPGPSNISENLLAELRKLSAGQTQLIAEVQGLKSQLGNTDKTIGELNKRLSDLESHYQSLVPLRKEIEVLRVNTEQTSCRIFALEARIDDAENRSRRNNLIFYGIPDPSASETFSESERLVMNLCRDNLQVHLEPRDIERAHRLGRHSPERSRPIIVKIALHKTKTAILSNGRKLKGTSYGIGEDFSRSVQNARKQLIAFARSNNKPFSMHFKTLHMNQKRYIFDAESNTVKELS
ncbi:uncharacterized protein LOC119163627 [Rhipicephalus microplus]|uniref:uncharacterized protein LOC119163627 n=1 Tax=Rhipicephalus microplus TaxID=6941 RepID=UPI003F6D2CBF